MEVKLEQRLTELRAGQPLEKAIKTLEEAGLAAGEIVEQKGSSHRSYGRRDSQAGTKARHEIPGWISCKARSCNERQAFAN